MSLHGQPLRFVSRINGHWLQRSQKLGSHRGVDTTATEAKAAWQAKHRVWKLASVDRTWHTTAAIEHRQLSAAATASDDASQQCPPAAARLAVAPLAKVVGCQRRLVPLELRPCDVALMVILDQDLPLLERLAMPVTATGLTLTEGSSLLAFPVDIDAGVEGVLEDPD